MTRFERWTVVAVLALVVLAHAAFPRYEVIVRDTAVMRWDRWTGHLDASANQNLAFASWATVQSTKAETVGLRGTEKIEPQPTGTATFSDIEKIAPSTSRDPIWDEVRQAAGHAAAEANEGKKVQPNRRRED
jgi:hypothetical protein